MESVIVGGCVPGSLLSWPKTQVEDSQILSDTILSDDAHEQAKENAKQVYILMPAASPYVHTAVHVRWHYTPLLLASISER